MHIKITSPKKPSSNLIYTIIYIIIHILSSSSLLLFCRQNLKHSPVNIIHWWLIPLSPHDALTQHITSLKTDFIFLQQRVLEWKFSWNWLTNTLQFSLIFSTTSNYLHPIQVENCDSNSRLAMDEDDNGKCRLERGNTRSAFWTVDQH